MLVRETVRETVVDTTNKRFLDIARIREISQEREEYRKELVGRGFRFIGDLHMETERGLINVGFVLERETRCMTARLFVEFVREIPVGILKDYVWEDENEDRSV